MTDRSIPPGEGVCGTCGSDDPAKRQRDPDSYHPDGCLNPFHTPSSDTQEGEGEAKRFRPCARCGHPKNDHADTDQKFCLLWRGPKRCECERWVDPAPPKPSLQVDEGARCGGSGLLYVPPTKNLPPSGEPCPGCPDCTHEGGAGDAVRAAGYPVPRNRRGAAR
jgi:hypothetical protein